MFSDFLVQVNVLLPKSSVKTVSSSKVQVSTSVAVVISFSSPLIFVLFAVTSMATFSPAGLIMLTSHLPVMASSRSSRALAENSLIVMFSLVSTFNTLVCVPLLSVQVNVNTYLYLSLPTSLLILWYTHAPVLRLIDIVEPLA